MAVLVGWIAASPLGGQTSSAITTALQQHLVGYWPPAAADVGLRAGGALVTHWPVSTTPRELSAWRALSFSDDWYHRVHVRPAELALGNVLETQTTPVRVWNAHLVPQLLTAIDGLDAGITVTGDGGPPTPFGALQELTWQVQVTRDGPGRIDVVLEWQFAAAAAPRLRITGNRVVAWGWAPDWSAGVRERLAWRTSIHSSPSGAEQRRALRLSPRRSFDFELHVHGRDRQVLDLALAGWSGRVWAMPVWPDVQQLAADVPAGAVALSCATDLRDFRAGGLAMLLGEEAAQAEAVEVSAVGPAGLTLRRPTQRAWPAGSRLYPARNAMLDEPPELLRKTDRLSRLAATVRLVDVSDWPAAALPLYRGAPVLAERPEESEDLATRWERLQLLLDNGMAAPVVTDTAEVGFAVQAHRWLMAGRTEAAAWRSVAYLLRGRQRLVWLPTHAEDLELAAVASAIASAIDVQAVGYTRFGLGRPGRRDVRVELSDGQVLHRRITGATELAGEQERLLLDAPVGVTLRPAATGDLVHVRRISWLQPMRLDQDELEIEHLTDSDGVAAVRALFRLVRDDLETVA